MREDGLALPCLNFFSLGALCGTQDCTPASGAVGRSWRQQVSPLRADRFDNSRFHYCCFSLDFSALPSPPRSKALKTWSSSVERALANSPCSQPAEAMRERFWRGILVSSKRRCFKSARLEIYAQGLFCSEVLLICKRILHRHTPILKTSVITLLYVLQNGEIAQRCCESFYLGSKCYKVYTKL